MLNTSFPTGEIPKNSNTLNPNNYQSQNVNLRENQAAGIVAELSNLLMQRFDLVKQALWDGDSATVFYPEHMLQVPKKCDFIPIEDATVAQSVNNALDQVESFRTLLRESIQKLKNESLQYKKKLDSLQFKVSQATELLDGKSISRAKMLLKVDCEFLRRTLPMQKAIPNDDEEEGVTHRQIYKESVDALKSVAIGSSTGA